MIVALNTGLRLGELQGLVWERVDLSRGVIRLEVTKSGRRREVPMNDDSYQALVSLEPREAGRVFQTRYIKSAYNAAVERAKLDDVNFHTLRRVARDDDAVRPPRTGASPHGGRPSRGADQFHNRRRVNPNISRARRSA